VHKLLFKGQLIGFEGEVVHWTSRKVVELQGSFSLDFKRSSSLDLQERWTSRELIIGLAREIVHWTSRKGHRTSRELIIGLKKR
jgi:hypothetical protein